MQTVNPQYRKLQQHLDKLPVGFPETESGVEIRILQHLFTPEESEIATYLNLIPTNAEKIYKRIKNPNYSVKELEVKLDSMGDKGAINRHISKNGSRYYSNALLAIGMFEFQVNKLTKEFYSDFVQYLEEAFRDEFLSTRIPQLRTIPTEGALAPDLPVMTYDNIRDIISTYKGPIAVANCICKQGKDLMGDPCHQTDMREICFTFGSSARKFVEDGLGRNISKEETFEILKQAEKDSLVLQPSNTEIPFCLCLCCGCCCEILSSAKPLENPVQYFATNYYAIVEKDSCIGCGMCEKRCQMDAISIIDKKSIVDYERCIGCGLCVVTCPKSAIKLEQVKKPRPPPKNAMKLYLGILRKKVGNARYIIMLTKQLFGAKL
ncbi:MAG: 4Fe-4S binding protein [Promethearchaeota archaeon]